MWRLLLVGWIMVVAGCGQPVDLPYYVNNPTVIAPTLAWCAKLPTAQRVQSLECRYALEAKQRLQALQQQLFLNPLAFGGQILAMQMRLGTLQQQLRAAMAAAQAKPELQPAVAALEKQKKALQALVRQYLVVIAHEDTLRF